VSQKLEASAGASVSVRTSAPDRFGALAWTASGAPRATMMATTSSRTPRSEAVPDFFILPCSPTPERTSPQTPSSSLPWLARDHPDRACCRELQHRHGLSDGAPHCPVQKQRIRTCCVRVDRAHATPRSPLLQVASTNPATKLLFGFSHIFSSVPTCCTTPAFKIATRAVLVISSARDVAYSRVYP
jgi:hypothetical protein